MYFTGVNNMEFKNQFFQTWWAEIETAEASIKYRAKNRLSEKEMAKLCRISHPTLRKIERGESVNPTSLYRVREKLKMDGEI